ncbi:hypothetical protein [Bradyrhizobium sp. Leo121]|uniref:hypothetical protein n=1 Tax=Bradyrhizobium sp. Leo121 TaxID=1571195 RepID=UPI001029C885|nr:hypothetical protein [Bradyrhizobium sp. Leo121]RZN20096.1 hypothetical protein CWO90_34475 [Bradyrhizobium sp. Leo121]
MLSKTLSTCAVAVTVAASPLIATAAFAQFPPPPPMVPAGHLGWLQQLRQHLQVPLSPALSLARGLGSVRELGRALISPREESGMGRLS